MTQSRVLLVHEEDQAGGALEAVMEAAPSVVTTSDIDAASDWLTTTEFDCVAATTTKPTRAMLTLLEQAAEEQPQAVTLLHARTLPDGIADQAAKRGITDVLAADSGYETLTRTIEQATAQPGAIGPSEDPQAVADPGEHTPTAEQIVQAVEQAPLGVTMLNPTLPEAPIVYLNDAYEELSGYSEDELLGHSLQVLQGPRTDPESVAALKEGIENTDTTSVEMRNYRSDGSQFWNRIMVAPVYDDGEVTHLVGFQEDITARREAEERARRRAASLDTERRALDRAHERFVAVLDAVTTVLADAPTREVVLSDVRVALDGIEPYVGGWAAYVDHDRGDPLARVVDGRSPATTDISLRLDTNGPVATAYQTGTVTTARPADVAADPITPEAFDATTLIVVPLVYREAVQGLLGIYVDHLEVVLDRETTVLSGIGTVLGQGLSAYRIQQALHADVVLELEFALSDPGLRHQQLAAAVGGVVTHNRFDTHLEEADRLHIDVDQPGADITQAVTDLEFVESVTAVTDRGDRAIVSMTVDRLPIVEQLAAAGLSLKSIEATEGEVTLQGRTPITTDVRSVVDALEAVFDTVELRSQREKRGMEHDPGEFVATVTESLTDRQLAALEAAYEAGYFEWPRPVEGSELAESMGITRQTFHQHLRAAEQKLFDAFFDP